MMKIQLQFAAALSALLLSAGLAQAALPAQVGETPVPSLAPMVKKVAPTVVNIATRGTVEVRNPLLDDPFFRQFFGEQPNAGPRQRQFQSAGSGVVVDARNGYIITNVHVVEDANEITVTMQDGHNFTAKVVGADKQSDVAVIKLNEKPANLSAISLGDSSKLEVGDFVVAIGNPFALQNTVTSGIVSALSRAPGISQDGLEDFIQTDASINPGNSGGALVNLKGELVGINSAILSQSGGNIGIGFAIPVNMVKSVMNQLIEYGEVKRGLLGVNIYTLTPDLVQATGAPADLQGALVSQVVEGSSADKAGIKVNDIITSVNGRQVKGAPELRNAIGMLRIGDKVEIGLIREGNPRRVTAVIGERSQATTAATDVHPGLQGAELADADNQAGVVIQSVVPGSPAAQSGLRANDLISGINRTRVTNVAQLRDAAAGQTVLLLTIRRGNALISIPVR
jgi:serine protease Do/serine protease DegQ